MARKQTAFTPCLSSFFDSQNALQTHLHQTNYTMVLLLLWETFPYLSMSGKGVNSGVSENLTTADNFLCSFTATFTRAYWTTTPPTSGFCSQWELAIHSCVSSHEYLSHPATSVTCLPQCFKTRNMAPIFIYKAHELHTANPSGLVFHSD